MEHLKLNKWQRLVLALGAVAFLSRAYVLWDEDDKPGTAFLVGIVLLVLTLTKPREGEEILPFWNRVANDDRITFRSVALVAGGLAIGAVAIGAATSYQSSDYAAEEAAADTIEMPAEEAMPADAAVAPVDVMAEDALSIELAKIAARDEAKENAEKAAQEAENAAREAYEASVRDAPQPTYYDRYRSNRYPLPTNSIDGPASLRA